LAPIQAAIDLSKPGNRRNEDSGRKYQQQEYGEEKQVNATL
jgi:hypothetical protein